MKNIYFLLILCLFSQLSHGQEGVSFKENKQLYLQGNSILIGNNILGEHTVKPLMNLTKPNDLVDMKYIDMDNDQSTFSSSEATIIDSPENTMVKYAALYWSGLYPFKKGILRKSGNKMVYVGRGDRTEKVNSIELKTPNGNYETVNGETIYDSYHSEDFETNKPYVCYADVTKRLQSLPTIKGTYTAANIKATEGKISGGGSAGWLLYIVYEDPTQSPKYFNIYNGLVEVNKKEVEINFKDFKSKEEGEVQTTIAIGALEGDRRIKTDQVSVLNEKTGDFIPLSNNVREKRNFFNSSITIGNESFTDRNPNSANTLGFDLLKMEIPNKENTLFDNTTTQANFKFQGKADRYYLFFVAFETEINNTFLQEKTEAIATVTTAKSPEPIANLTQHENLKQLEKAVATEKDIEIVKTMEENVQKNLPAAEEVQKSAKSNLPKEPVVIASEDTKKAKLKKETKIRSMSIPGLDPGYYIITNAFSSISNAENWSKTLKEKNFHPGTFVNPENKLNYVYIAKGKALNSIYEKWIANKDLALFKDIWIAEIN
ncbi:hypothetical protein [Aequorivita capsosiphonis]|uniref:hypothetical protein n=1 Tax=Aequorivita capsosiphonis TaxID=487317 RepID=UPI0003FA2759|nr:hypothetical protein [Aequorivita capsosiphonis]